MPIISRGLRHKRTFASDHRCERQLRELAAAYQRRLGVRLNPSVIIRRAVLVLVTAETWELDAVKDASALHPAHERPAEV
jgi:predicted transcriptional regulator